MARNTHNTLGYTCNTVTEHGSVHPIRMLNNSHIYKYTCTKYAYIVCEKDARTDIHTLTDKESDKHMIESHIQTLVSRASSD